jgi:hypothetical protein
MIIINTTKQHHVFSFRTKSGGTRLVQQTIPVGQQVPLSGSLTPDDINYICEQHEPYGFMSVEQAEKETDYHKVSGILWSYDPVPVERISDLMEKVKGGLVEQGAEFRKLAAIASNEEVETVVKNSPITTSNMDITIEEQPKPGEIGRSDLLVDAIEVARPNRSGTQRTRSK